MCSRLAFFQRLRASVKILRWSFSSVSNPLDGTGGDPCSFISSTPMDSLRCRRFDDFFFISQSFFPGFSSPPPSSPSSSGMSAKGSAHEDDRLNRFVGRGSVWTEPRRVCTDCRRKDIPWSVGGRGWTDTNCTVCTPAPARARSRGDGDTHGTTERNGRRQSASSRDVIRSVGQSLTSIPTAHITQEHEGDVTARVHPVHRRMHALIGIQKNTTYVRTSHARTSSVCVGGSNVST